MSLYPEHIACPDFTLKTTIRVLTRKLIGKVSTMQVGVEYLRGWRTDFSSSTRHANRLNMLVQYSF